MKKFLCLLAVICSILIYSITFAGVVKLKWDPSDPITNVDSYVLYIQEENAPIRSVIIPKESNTYLLADLDLKIKTNYVFWVTAKNNNGESDDSNHIQYYSSVPNAPVLELIEE